MKAKQIKTIKIISVVTFIILLTISYSLGYMEYKVKKETAKLKAAQQEIIKSNQEKADIKTEKIDTSNWETYKNEKYGFSFKYPKDIVKLNESDKNKYVDGYVQSEEDIAKKMKEPYDPNLINTVYARKDNNQIQYFSVTISNDVKDFDAYVKKARNFFIQKDEIELRDAIIIEELHKTDFLSNIAYKIKLLEGRYQDSEEKDKFETEYIFVKRNGIVYEIYLERTDIYNEVFNSFKFE